MELWRVMLRKEKLQGMAVVLTSVAGVVMAEKSEVMEAKMTRVPVMLGAGDLRVEPLRVWSMSLSMLISGLVPVMGLTSAIVPTWMVYSKVVSPSRL